MKWLQRFLRLAKAIFRHLAPRPRNRILVELNEFDRSEETTVQVTRKWPSNRPP